MIASEIREALTGPVPTVRTPFLKNGAIDYAALRGMVDFAIANGAKSVVLTAGDSHLIALSDREIGDLTKATVEAVHGRAMVVAADRQFHTRQAVDFARQCLGLGVDVLMLMPPDWECSTCPESMADHYATVSEILPVMIVTNVFLRRGAEFGIKTIELALHKSKNIVSIKDDFCGEFGRRLALRFHERCAVWAGGMKENHLNMAPYGGTGYLSTFITFCPSVARRYWDAFSAGDLKSATSIVAQYDMPFFDLILSVPGGFDAALHGVLELYGLAQRWRPKPYLSIGDEDMEKLAAFLKGKQLL